MPALSSYLGSIQIKRDIAEEESRNRPMDATGEVGNNDREVLKYTGFERMVSKTKYLNMLMPLYPIDIK